ncbi:FecR domain-containing protein [Chitinophaga qingshengii]|nr:FecR domain-containing protein [Chitinophaga qingshengii]
MITPEILQRLLDEYAMGTISPEDRQQLLAILRDPQWADEVAGMLQRDLETGRYDVVAAELPEVQQRIRQRLSGLTTSAPAPRGIFALGWRKVAAAVILVAGLSTAVVYLTRSGKQPATKQPAAVAVNIGPGGNKAMLTLSDGSTVPLDQASDGLIAQQGNTQVVKLANGRLAYQPQGGADTAMRWNTISTPRGGEYQVTLPDGTKAWLNAASSITFPAAFAQHERPIKVTGEVYLEVAQVARQPFMVTARNVTVNVLGTSFNINAYNDETYTKITLVTGSVKVKVHSREWQLKPGQQAGISDTIVNIQAHTDIEQILAWKNGLFNFNGADLPTVMRQLERWYGIQVKYEGPVPGIIFKGEMYKNVNLSDVIEMLKAMGVKFTLQDSTLTVKG